MTEADSAAATDLAIQLNLVVPDHMPPDVVALGLLSYLTSLANTATRDERHRMAVMTCNAAAELAGLPPIGGQPGGQAATATTPNPGA
jgi:hypothetical protein